MSQMNLIGSTLGRFEVISELGRGGMAIVYKARQADLDRIVALKVLPPELTHDSSYVARFRQEARSAARLEHPHIMPIFEVGEADGLHFIAMKFIQGKTLKDYIQEEGALPIARAAQALAQVGEALDYAHRQGVIHRDVKPSNVMITDEGWVYLTDFGLARGTGGTSGLTMAGTVMGTPEYMSPEQAQGLDSVGPPTDIYALGVVLYELITGTFPFKADTPMGMLAARLMQAPIPPRDVRGDLPSAVEDVVMRALARSPEARFASAGDMVTALRQAAGLTVAQAQRPITPQSGMPAVGPTIVAPQQTPTTPPTAPQQAPAYPNPTAPTSPVVPPPIRQAAPAQPQTPPYVRQQQPLPTQQPQQAAFNVPYTPAPPTTPAGGAAPARPSTFGRFLSIGVGVIIVLALIASGLFWVFSRNNGPDPVVVQDPELAALLDAGDSALERSGGIPDAIESYRQALARDPGNPAALSKLALAYNLGGDWANTEEYAAQLIDNAGDDETRALGHALRADAIASQGAPAEALDSALQAIDLDPDLALGHAIHSNILAARASKGNDVGLMDAALGALDDAYDEINDDPPVLQALAYNALAYTFAEEYFLNDNTPYFTESENSYFEAIDRMPTIALFRTNLGYLYNADGLYNEARGAFNNALENDPDYAEAQAGIGWSYYSDGDNDRAREAFEQAIALNAGDYNGYYGLGRVLMDEREYGAAIDQFNQAASRNRRNADVQTWLGEAYLFAGFNTDDEDQKDRYYIDAESAYRRAIEIEDRYAFALAGLAWILQYQERYDESLTIFERALSIDDSDDDTHNGYGWSLFNVGRYDEAERSFSNAIARDTDNDYASAHYGRGRALEELGRLSEAAAEFEIALDIDPGYDSAREALERVSG
jgi:serine/threonine protein kinase/tetratricopeptide (TPR) repeat protein